MLGPGKGLVFALAFVPVLLLGPLAILGPVDKPGKGLVFVLGPPATLGPVGGPGGGLCIAHVALEQNRLYDPMAGSHARGWELHLCIDVDEDI